MGGVRICLLRHSVGITVVWNHSGNQALLTFISETVQILNSVPDKLWPWSSDVLHAAWSPRERKKKKKKKELFVFDKGLAINESC